MNLTAVFKRAVPFALTFGAGLLIASIFVPLSVPTIESRSGSTSYGHSDCKKKRPHYKELRNENIRLRQQLEELRRATEVSEIELTIPKELDVPAPPAPPAKEIKMKTVTVK